MPVLRSFSKSIFVYWGHPHSSQTVGGPWSPAKTSKNGIHMMKKPSECYSTHPKHAGVLLGKFKLVLFVEKRFGTQMFDRSCGTSILKKTCKFKVRPYQPNAAGFCPWTVWNGDTPPLTLTYWHSSSRQASHMCLVPWKVEIGFVNDWLENPPMTCRCVLSQFKHIRQYQWSSNLVIFGCFLRVWEVLLGLHWLSVVFCVAGCLNKQHN